MNNTQKKVDRLDAKIMWWFYDMIELHFDCKAIVIDSTEIRKMIRKALQDTREEAYKQARKDINQQYVDKLYGKKLSIK